MTVNIDMSKQAETNYLDVTCGINDVVDTILIANIEEVKRNKIVCMWMRPSLKRDYYECITAEQMYRVFCNPFGVLKPLPPPFAPVYISILYSDAFQTCKNCEFYAETSPAIEDAKIDGAISRRVNWPWYGFNNQKQRQEKAQAE